MGRARGFALIAPSIVGCRLAVGARFGPELRSFGGRPGLLIARAFRRASRVVGRRELTQREVLGEAPGGEPFLGAGQEGEQCAAGGIRLAEAACEVGRDARAPERLGDGWSICRGGAEEDGHPIQRDAPRRLAMNLASDLDALASLARSGKHSYVFACGAGLRRRFRKQVLLKLTHPRRTSRSR